MVTEENRENKHLFNLIFNVLCLTCFIGILDSLAYRYATPDLALSFDQVAYHFWYIMSFLLVINEHVNRRKELLEINER